MHLHLQIVQVKHTVAIKEILCYLEELPEPTHDELVDQ